MSLPASTLLLLAAGLSWAGASDAELRAGIVAMDRGDTAAALEHLEAAMASPGELRPEGVPGGR